MLQRGRLQIETIVDLNLDPFLNNGFGSEFSYNSKSVLLVSDLISKRKFGFGSETEST